MWSLARSGEQMDVVLDAVGRLVRVDVDVPRRGDRGRIGSSRGRPGRGSRGFAEEISGPAGDGRRVGGHRVARGEDGGRSRRCVRAARLGLLEHAVPGHLGDGGRSGRDRGGHLARSGTGRDARREYEADSAFCHHSGLQETTTPPTRRRVVDELTTLRERRNQYLLLLPPVGVSSSGSYWVAI